MTKRRFPWATWSTERLLQLRIKDLGLTIEGTWLEPRIDALYETLERRGEAQRRQRKIGGLCGRREHGQHRLHEAYRETSQAGEAFGLCASGAVLLAVFIFQKNLAERTHPLLGLPRDADDLELP